MPDELFSRSDHSLREFWLRNLAAAGHRIDPRVGPGALLVLAALVREFCTVFRRNHAEFRRWLMGGVAHAGTAEPRAPVTAQFALCLRRDMAHLWEHRVKASLAAEPFDRGPRIEVARAVEQATLQVQLGRGDSLVPRISWTEGDFHDAIAQSTGGHVEPPEGGYELVAWFESLTWPSGPGGPPPRGRGRGPTRSPDSMSAPDSRLDEEPQAEERLAEERLAEEVQEFTDRLLAALPDLSEDAGMTFLARPVEFIGPDSRPLSVLEFLFFATQGSADDVAKRLANLRLTVQGRAASPADIEACQARLRPTFEDLAGVRLPSRADCDRFVREECQGSEVLRMFLEHLGTEETVPCTRVASAEFRSLSALQFLCLRYRGYEGPSYRDPVDRASDVDWRVSEAAPSAGGAAAGALEGGAPLVAPSPHASDLALVLTMVGFRNGRGGPIREDAIHQWLSRLRRGCAAPLLSEALDTNIAPDEIFLDLKPRGEEGIYGADPENGRALEYTPGRLFRITLPRDDRAGRAAVPRRLLDRDDPYRRIDDIAVVSTDKQPGLVHEPVPANGEPRAHRPE